MKEKNLILLIMAVFGLFMYADPTCPSDCDAEELPEIESNICNPTLDFSEVDHIYLTQLGNPLTSVTDAAEWAARLDDSLGDPADPSHIRTIPCKGAYPEPETNEVEIDQGRTVQGNSKHTVSYKVFDLPDKMYEFMRKTFCGNTWLAWFSAGGYIYGGNSGIQVNVSMKPSITEGVDEPNTLVGTMKWKAKFPPERSANPLV